MLSFVQRCEHNRRDENGEMSQKAVWEKSRQISSVSNGSIGLNKWIGLTLKWNFEILKWLRQRNLNLVLFWNVTRVCCLEMFWKEISFKKLMVNMLQASSWAICCFDPGYKISWLPHVSELQLQPLQNEDSQAIVRIKWCAHPGTD